MCKGDAGPDTRSPRCTHTLEGLRAGQRRRKHPETRSGGGTRALEASSAQARYGPPGTLLGAGSPSPTAALWLLSTEGGVCFCSPTSVGAGGPRWMRLSCGRCPRDGSVLGVHLPDVGTLHTDPGERREGEEGVRHSGEIAPQKHPQDHTYSPPTSPALVLDLTV